MKRPNWFDSLLSEVLETHDLAGIAHAIAASPRFQAAIARGLEKRPEKGMYGPSFAQAVADEIKAELVAQ